MFINSIVIKDLEIDCIIGIHPGERTTPQKIAIDIRAELDFSRVMQSGSIHDTVDYSLVSERIQAIAQNSKYKLLEALAANIAKELFERFPITFLEMEFKKSKRDSPPARYVGVIFRQARHQPLQQSAAPEMTRELKTGHRDRVALVTGAAKGLGRGFARHLSHQGCTLAVHYHQSRDAAESLVEEIQSEGGQAKAFSGDLASYEGMKNLAAAVQAQWGRVDYLINNVGAYTTKGLFELTAEEFSSIIQTNICGTFFLTREILPMMREKRFGRVVNIGQAGTEHLRAHPKETPYHISKNGVLILTKSIAQAEASFGITCNMISPGFLENSIDLPPDCASRIPMGRPGKFEDLFAALDYFLSPAASYVTGTQLEVTGGYGL